jgi:VWFA-related protein
MAMLSHRQGCSFVVIASLFSFIFNIPVLVAQTPATFRSSVSEVRFSIFATDEHNHALENVAKDDFAVVDNGVVIRDFRSLARSSETNLHVLELIDASESANPRLANAMKSVVDLTTRRFPGDDFYVVSFSGLRPDLICDADCDAPAVQPKLLALKAGGATPLFDAIDYAARFLSERHVAGERDVILLVSDGRDTVSKISAPDALQTAITRGVLLYAVNLNSSADSSNGTAVLEFLADATGGRSFALTDDSTEALHTILADMHASYVVTYLLPGRVAGFHSLRILPKHNLNLRFHCQRGYSYEEVR